MADLPGDAAVPRRHGSHSTGSGAPDREAHAAEAADEVVLAGELDGHEEEVREGRRGEEGRQAPARAAPASEEDLRAARALHGWRRRRGERAGGLPGSGAFPGLETWEGKAIGVVGADLEAGYLATQ